MEEVNTHIRPPKKLTGQWPTFVIEHLRTCRNRSTCANLIDRPLIFLRTNCLWTVHVIDFVYEQVKFLSVFFYIIRQLGQWQWHKRILNIAYLKYWYFFIQADSVKGDCRVKCYHTNQTSPYCHWNIIKAGLYAAQTLMKKTRVNCILACVETENVAWL